MPLGPRDAYISCAGPSGKTQGRAHSGPDGVSGPFLWGKSGVQETPINSRKLWAESEQVLLTLRTLPHGEREVQLWGGEDHQSQSSEAPGSGPGPLLLRSQGGSGARRCTRKGDTELKYAFPDVKGTYTLVWFCLECLCDSYVIFSELISNHWKWNHENENILIKKDDSYINANCYFCCS